jgi:membrane protein DedA with SNARE-associated domain
VVARLPDLLARYGAPVLFFAQMFGIFGLPIPDELLLTIAGTLIRHGRLNALATLTAAIGGCIAGITLSYCLGRAVGCRILQRIPGVESGSIARAQAWFTRFGGWLLTFAFFVPGVRHVGAIIAGSLPLDFRVFAAYAYPGAVLWSVTFVAAGYYAGDRWERAALMLRGHVVFVALAAGVAAAAYAITRRSARA